MPAVLFQNGPDAPVAIRIGQYETKDEAKTAAEKAVSDLGTSSDAHAWIEGERGPKWAAETVVDA